MKPSSRRRTLTAAENAALAPFRHLDGATIGGLELTVGLYFDGRAAMHAVHPIRGPDCVLTASVPDEYLHHGEFFVPALLKRDRPKVFHGLKYYARPTGRVVRSRSVADFAEAWELN